MLSRSHEITEQDEPRAAFSWR